MMELGVLLAIAIVLITIIVPIWTLVLVHVVRREAFNVRMRLEKLQTDVEQLTQTVQPHHGAAVPGAADAKGPATHARQAPAAARPPAAAPAAPCPASAGAPPPLPPALAPAAPHTAAAEPAVASPHRVHSAQAGVLGKQPRAPSAFERRARALLRQMWSWIVIGADHRPPGVSYEYAVATNWLLRIGIVILVTGIGFFLKYSINHGWLGPQGRVAISIFSGLVMLGLGMRLAGRRYHLLGQGLLGGGMATLYFSVFAAYSMYALIGAATACAAMMAITFSAGFIAVRFDALLVALLGIVGGYLTPVMIAAAPLPPAMLFAYLTVLSLGVLGVAYYKRWYLLNYLAFLGTYILYFLRISGHQPAVGFWTAFPFLLVFFAIFSTVTFVYCVAQRARATLLELLMLLVNTAVVFGSGYGLLSSAYGRASAAWLTVGLALFYIMHVYVFLVRKLGDKGLLLVFLALASFFVTMTLPLVLTREWLTVSWSVQALIMLWLAVRLGSNFLLWLGLAVYGVVLVRLGVLDFPRAFGSFSLPALEAMAPAQYVAGMLERALMFGIPASSLGGAWWVMRNARGGAPARMVPPEVDVAAPGPHERLVPVLMWLGVLVVFYYVHQEAYGFWAVCYAPLRLPFQTLVWALLGAAVLAAYRRSPSWIAYGGVLVISAAVLVKLFAHDMPAWEPVLEHARYGVAYTAGTVLCRAFDFVIVVALFSMLARAMERSGRAWTGVVALGAAMGLAWLYLTLETSSALAVWLPRMRAGGVSIVWALYALGLLIAGIQRGARGLRYPGLALFGIVMIKVFFFDLDHLDQLYRIIAFVVLGLLFLSGALLYLKYQNKLALPNESAQEAT